jgi:aminopeptidase N
VGHGASSRATERLSQGSPTVAHRYSENRDGNVTTADFVALSERVADQRLQRFFRVWLFREGKPRSW